MHTYSIAAGILLIIVPILFNVFFALLSAKFEYPDILRKPTGEILKKYQAGGTSLKLLWLGFAYTALLFAPLAIMFGQVFTGSRLSLLTIIIGVLAGFVQFLGLIRWSFLVPELARQYNDMSPKAPERKTIELVFSSAHRYLGVSIGEHTGYFLTGLWTFLMGVMIIRADFLPNFLGWVGLVIGVMVGLGALEFVGKYEKNGWKLIDKLVPVAYILWSLWLIACGIALLIHEI